MDLTSATDHHHSVMDDGRYSMMGTRRRVIQDPDSEDRVIKIIRSDTKISRNVNEWFIWNMVRVTHLEPLFVAVFECRLSGRQLVQQRVDCVGDRWHREIDEIILQIPNNLRRGWVDKRGRPHYHTWSRNPLTDHLQIYDYESMDRYAIAELIKQPKVIQPVFVRETLGPAARIV